MPSVASVFDPPSSKVVGATVCRTGDVLTRQMEGPLLQGLQALLEHVPPGQASGAQVVL